MMELYERADSDVELLCQNIAGHSAASEFCSISIDQTTPATGVPGRHSAVVPPLGTVLAEMSDLLIPAHGGIGPAPAYSRARTFATRPAYVMVSCMMLRASSRRLRRRTS